MAIVTGIHDIEHQDKIKQFKAVEGKDKIIMRALGYDQAGGRTGLGKLYSALTPFVDMAAPGLGTALSIGGKQVAKRVSRGTDTGKVLEETGDEFVNKEISRLTAMLDTGTAVAGAMGAEAGGGTLSQVLTGGGGSATTGGVPSMATPGINAAGGTSALGDAGGAAMTETIPDEVFKDAGTGAEFLDSDFATSGNQMTQGGTIDNPIDGLENTEVGKKLLKAQEQTEIDKAKDAIDENIKKREKQKKDTQRMNQILAKGPKAVGSIAKWVMSEKDYVDEAEKEKKRLLSQRVMSEYNYL